MIIKRRIIGRGARLRRCYRIIGVCGLALTSALVGLPTLAPVAANADASHGATDWIFPSAYSDGSSYDHPENVLVRDDATAHADAGGLITVHDFAPIDLPLGATIDKVELRFHMAGEHAIARFEQYFPSYMPCNDHNTPGYVKDFIPTSTTTLDDYIVEYSSQDCGILPDNVRRGQYFVAINRYNAAFGNFTVDDISVRFTYTARSVAVSSQKTSIGTPVTTSYACPSDPRVSVVQANGQPADGVTFGAPNKGDNGHYTQDISFASSGDYAVHVQCEIYDMPSPTLSVVDPAESVSDWLFPTAVSGSSTYDDARHVLNRDGVLARSNSGNGYLALSAFMPIRLPAGATVRKVEIRSHLGGDRTVVGFAPDTASGASCTDHNTTNAKLAFLPHSETVVDDYIVNYTVLDCSLTGPSIQQGNYQVTVNGYYPNSIYNIDDVSVRFTYTNPVPAVAVTPGSALAGTTFTAAYQCRQTPYLSVRTQSGEPATNVVTRSPITADNFNYTQAVRLNDPGVYVVFVSCGSQQMSSANVTVFKPLSYVGLGDSYSSGEGDPPYDLSRPCHRSSLAWPTRVATFNASRIVTSKSIACSGATTRALFESYRGEDPQLSLVRSARPDIITITIGGNDVDFAGYIRWCYLPLPCNNRLDQAATAVNELIRLLPSTYTSIRNAAGANARIVIVGYPRLFPLAQAENRHCGWLSDGERTRFNSLAAQLDQGMAAAAGHAGMEYVSTLDALAGHELCTDRSWMTPVPSWPVESSAHPTTDGHQAIADLVNRRLAL